MTHPPVVTITPLTGIPEVRAGDDLAALLVAGLVHAGISLTEGDILAVSSKIGSKALGLVADSTDRQTVVSTQAVRVVAERVSGAPLDGDVAARSARAYVSRVVESVAGPVMAAAGVDASNTGGGDVLLLLPADPDAVCRDLHSRLAILTGVSRFGIVLTDTAGRPWRVGQIDFALGAHGLLVVDDLRGSVDADGRSLDVTVRGIADEIAAAADLVKGKSQGVPAALVRGLGAFVVADGAGARSMVKTGAGDWFDLGPQEAVRAALGVPPGSALAEAAGIRPMWGDTQEDAVVRAVRVGSPGPGERWAQGVAVSGRGPITVTGPDPIGVGMVAARVAVALAGEGVAHRLDVGSAAVTIEVEPAER